MEAENIENLSSDESHGDDQRKGKATQEPQPPKKKQKTNKRKAPTDKKRKGSLVWIDFEKVEVDGEQKAKCKHCNSILGGESVNGTSHLRRHIKICGEHPAKKKGQANVFLKNVDDVEGGPIEVRTWKFCAKTSRKALAEMIVLDELPFAIVEHEGFKRFMESVCPNFKLPSRHTISRDIGDIYLSEKAVIKSFFQTSKARICLTTDTWTSIQRVNYMCVTAHFIDENWVLHKRVINFKPIFSHKGEEIGRMLLQSLKEWEINNILAITTDNASSNDSAMTFLKGKLPNLLCNGRFLHVRCMAHIINLIVMDGLKKEEISINRIRNAIRYIRMSPKRLDSFKKCAINEKISTKALLCLDCPTRWNSTYEMISRAEKFEKAFDAYDLEDSNYSKFLDNNVPKSTDWHYARKFAHILELFKRSTIFASTSNSVVVNMFFKEIMAIDKMLREMTGSNDGITTAMGTSMREKYDKYWRFTTLENRYLYFATILDPRQKARMLTFGYSKICYAEKKKDDKKETVDKKIEEIIDPINNDFKLLFEEYKLLYDNGSSSSASEVDASVNVPLEVEDDFLTQFKSEGGFSMSSSKSELQKYLDDKEEECYVGFDILGWWKSNSSRYPILSRMAKDILAIPVSSVASESAFSTGGRVVDSYRSSLSPPVVESLICTQDWIRKTRKIINEDVDSTDFDEIGKEIADNLEPSQTITEIN